MRGGDGEEGRWRGGREGGGVGGRGGKGEGGEGTCTSLPTPWLAVIWLTHLLVNDPFP